MGNIPVVYWELASHDAEKSAELLRAIFGWEPNWDEQIGLYDFAAGEHAARFAGGGVFTLRKAKLPFLTIYIRVDDIQEKARLVQEHGGGTSSSQS
jgi:predicted enzyme related to lactoylglutathione lyase